MKQIQIPMNTLRNPIRRSFAAAFVAAAVAASALAAQAQEILPREEAMKLALVATLAAPSTADAPIQVDADLKRPLAGHDEEFGLLILPETKLNAAALEAAGKTPVPLGQLWLRKLTPMVDGGPVESSAHRMVTIQHEGETHRVPLCLLGARKTDAGGLELLVYGKGKEPLARVPLQKIERKQQLPIEISAERESDSGRLTFFIAGRYEATLRVTELPE